jgi:hypothetical protein
MKETYISWEDLIMELRSKLGLSDEINAILFFIGIQESGKGFRKFTREEKTTLILLGQQIVTKYSSASINSSNQMSEQNLKLSHLSSDQYIKQLKEGILHYFNTHKNF